MKKVWRIVILILLVGLLVFFEVKWISASNYDNQKNRTIELMSDIAGEISLIEVRLMEDGEVGEEKARFDTALFELKSIPYATQEKADLIEELVVYEGAVLQKSELAKELKILRSLCAGFVEKMAINYKQKTVDASLFRAMNKEFLELTENLPDVKYGPAHELVVELKGVMSQVAVSSASTANCIGVCAKTTLDAQKNSLEKKLSDALVKIDALNKTIRDEFDSGELVWRLHNI